MFRRSLRCAFNQCLRQYKQHVNAGAKLSFSGLARQQWVRKGHLMFLWLPTFTTVHALGWSSTPKGPNLAKMDQLFDENKFEEICQELAPYKHTKNVEVLWRIARALYKRSKVEKDDKKRHQLLIDGYEVVKEALELDPNNSPVHKWYGILLDAKSLFEGMKARITVTETVKQHLMKAVELNPKDATTMYMIGLWCYEVTILPWYQRKIAAAIFATPPTSSFEEALEYFERAERISPNFFSMNLLLLGKVYDRLGQREKAIPFVKRARDYPPTNDDDHQANKEATELLKNWGVK